MTVENDTNDDTVYSLQSGDETILPILLRLWVHFLVFAQQLFTLGLRPWDGPHLKLSDKIYAGHLGKKGCRYRHHNNHKKWSVTFAGLWCLKKEKLEPTDRATLGPDCEIKLKPE